MGKAVLSEKGGSIFLTLFGVPFFIVGCLILYFMVLSPYFMLKDSQTWPEVNAEILDLQYAEKIQPLTVKYSYIYEGKNYVSNSLYLDLDFTFNESQKSIYLALKVAFDKSAKVSAYVNPENPQQSALFRELKDDDIMLAVVGSIFAVVGLCIIIGGLFMYRSASAKEFYQKENPDEPWMWDKVWRLGLSKPERKSNLIIGFIFICFWYGLTAVIFLVFYKESLEQESLSYISSGMALFGVLFIYFYIKRVFKYKKYGQSYLDIKTLPGRLGQEFKGEIYAPFFLRPEGDIYFSIDCRHHYSEGTGDDRRSKTDLLYKHEFSVAPEKARSSQDAFVIPVSFQLPEDKPASSNSIFWTLNAYAATVGIDWSETYKIPVYK